MKNKKEKQKSSSVIERKSGQEEMVGFALILIIVAVVIVIFLGFSLGNDEVESVDSYKVGSFIQAFLQYNTNCTKNNLEYRSIRNLIRDCSNKEVCLDGRNTCEILERELRRITAESWKIGENRPIKGYELLILSRDEEMLSIIEGNLTGHPRGVPQDFSEKEIFFTVYY
ncbi:hypothetical protein ACFL0X_02545 [Nanoarchaeota archaeon]